jgi:solute carrier family 40 (iron-regulated transporter), member 1
MVGAFMPNSKLADDFSNDNGQVELIPFLGTTGTVEKKDDSALLLDKVSALDEEPSTPIDAVYTARRLLYLSHFFAQWNVVSWNFGLALILAAVTRYESFALVTSYAMSLCGATVLMSGRIGQWMDYRNVTFANERLAIVQWLIGLETIAVVLVTVFCFQLLSSWNESSMHASRQNATYGDDAWTGLLDTPRNMVALAVIHIMGSLAHVLDQAVLVAMERDWVVVLSQSGARAQSLEALAHDQLFSQWLSSTNVTMKQIDLSCKVAAPAVAGFLISWWTDSRVANDMQWVGLYLGIGNVVALLVESICTWRIYRLIPPLAAKTTDSARQTSDGLPIDAAALDLSQDQATNAMARAQRSGNVHHCVPRCRETRPNGLAVYMQQSSAWAGIALALLYVNTLTFGNGIMTTYLLHHGMRLETVGLMQGLAAAIGLVGTLAYHYSAQRLSLEATGLWSIMYQTSCLGVTMLSLLVANDTLELLLLLGGLFSSRIGLWVFDIAVTQLQQEEVPEHVRSQVGGLQQSLNALFNLLGFSVGLLFPNPNDFPVYIAVGFLSVFCAAVLFTLGFFLPRLSKCSA